MLFFQLSTTSKSEVVVEISHKAKLLRSTPKLDFLSEVARCDKSQKSKKIDSKEVVATLSIKNEQGAY